MQFTIIIYENGLIVLMVRTHKKRRFLKIIRSIKWQNSTKKVYIKLLDKHYLPWRGRRIRAFNDGTCFDKESLLFAVNAFLED